VVAAFTTTTDGVRAWKDHMDSVLGAASTKGPGAESAPPAVASLCYLDGAFGPAKGPSSESPQDYDRITYWLDGRGDVTPLVWGSRATLPIVDPDDLKVQS
jgi:hypothetical protein